MVDLDSDPTKLIEVVEIGKQLLMTRGALTTFSIANDLAKYFAVIPAMFIVTLPELQGARHHGPGDQGGAYSAILAAVIFNAIIIPLLIPIALKGVTYRPVGAGALLRRNLLYYGLGGVIAPFIGIKLIDLAIDPLLALVGMYKTSHHRSHAPRAKPHALFPRDHERRGGEGALSPRRGEGTRFSISEKENS